MGEIQGGSNMTGTVYTFVYTQIIQVIFEPPCTYVNFEGCNFRLKRNAEMPGQILELSTPHQFLNYFFYRRIACEHYRGNKFIQQSYECKQIKELYSV